MHCMPSIRRTLARSLLALGSTLVTLCLLELGLRVSGYDALKDIADGSELAIRASPDPELVYELTPGARGRIWGCDVSINSGGFRDQEYALQRPDGVTRIIALGDSITFGNSLPIEGTWTSLLENALNLRVPGIEVLNFGVGGYDIDQEVRLLETKGLSYDPDYVILAYCVNDLGTASLNLTTLVRLESCRRGILSWSRLAQWLATRAYNDKYGHDIQQERDAQRLARYEVESLEDEVLDELLATVQRSLDEVQVSADGSDKFERKVLGWYTNPSRIQAVREAFARLAELSIEHEFELVIFVVPYLLEEPFSEGWMAVYAMIRHMAEQAGALFLDVRPEMAERGLSRLTMTPKDGIHPKTLGHRGITRTIFKASRDWAGLGPSDGKR